eukprot:2449377-Amphidinium_carterae.1
MFSGPDQGLLLVERHASIECAGAIVLESLRCTIDSPSCFCHLGFCLFYSHCTCMCLYRIPEVPIFPGSNLELELVHWQKDALMLLAPNTIREILES